MTAKVSNRIKHPEAWKFWEEQARNIMGEPDLVHMGNYRIPIPDKSGNFLYAKTVEELWGKFIDSWYNLQGLNAPTVRGKIQFIVNNL
jgi:hypothetical protein